MTVSSRLRISPYVRLNQSGRVRLPSGKMVPSPRIVYVLETEYANEAACGRTTNGGYQYF